MNFNMCSEISDKMARQPRSSCTDDLPTNPPPIVGMEVFARWKRTWKGEVIMTIVMPNDVVDTRSLCEDPQRTYWNPGGPMDVLHLEKNMEFYPPPNTQTKEKMRKYKLQKAGRRISLFRTAGRNRQMRNSHWSPRPEARPHLPLHAERKNPLSMTRSSNLLKATSPITLPRHCCIKRDREKNSLMALQQTVPIQTLTMNNQAWQVDFTLLPCHLNPHQSMSKD